MLFLRLVCVNSQFRTIWFHKVLFSFILNSQLCLSGLNYSTKQLQNSLLAECPLKAKALHYNQRCCYKYVCTCTQFPCKSGLSLYLMLSMYITGKCILFICNNSNKELIRWHFFCFTFKSFFFFFCFSFSRAWIRLIWCLNIWPDSPL